ncbi:hypothetical protein [Streptomyces sp. AHA2]|uniref:hypothetical protein n=1 Tax=Streptomyces sp. AHA2 TaxID=3064526 RepID=UPI002FDF247B
MRKVLTTIGTLASAVLLAVGLTTSAHAATGPLYITQSGQTIRYMDPAPRKCITTDPTKGEVTFYNQTSAHAMIFDGPTCGNMVRTLHRGERATGYPGWAVGFFE